MIIDATWPQGSEQLGLPVNVHFIWGQDMQLACEPIEQFVVPDDVEPQVYKDELLRRHFSKEEIDRREQFFSMIAG